MKKIVAVIGSPKAAGQSSTAALAAGFIESLKRKCEGVESEMIVLSEKNISPCRGCMACQKTGRCVLSDDMDSVKKSVMEADLLILGSPVHFNHVSSLFQNYVERSLLELHTFDLLGKPLITAVTTNGSGEDDAEKYLARIGLLFGAVKIGKIVRIDNEKFKKKEYDALVEKTARLLSGKKKIRPSLMNRLYFYSMKKIIKGNKKYFEKESGIWEERGWFDKGFVQVFKETREKK